MTRQINGLTNFRKLIETRKANGLIELVRTNDLVTISLIDSLLKEAGILHFLLDQHMSVLEGSIGVLQRRIMVENEREVEARRLLKDAGLGEHLKDNGRDG